VQGYAVIDIVTSGPSPSQDRIIEVAIAHVDIEGHVTAVWETLVNPARTLGPLRVRGIRSSDLALAPEFQDVAGELCALIEGRVIVAHDADFPLGALSAELARVGIDHPPLGPISLCTMELIQRLVGGTPTLAECAAGLGVDMLGVYSAQGYALVVAKLLRDLVGDRSLAPVLREARGLADATEWPSFVPSGFSLTPRPRDHSSSLAS
jgi:DNA polymerase-3 subunit epsilon